MEVTMTQSVNYKKTVPTLFEPFEKNTDGILTWMMHEINNPITLINTSLQFIETSNPNLKNDRYWLRLNKDMRSLILLLREYSNYGQSQVINLTTNNLVELMWEVLESFEISASQKHVALNFCQESPIPPCALHYACDQVKMREVFINIIKNALEAVPFEGAVQIRFDYHSDSQLPFTIEISNNGPMIEADIAQQLFQPFFTTKKNGTGIGLAIAQKVIEAHHGKISLSSSSTETRFSIRLPALSAES